MFPTAFQCDGWTNATGVYDYEGIMSWACLNIATIHRFGGLLNVVGRIII